MKKSGNVDVSLKSINQGIKDLLKAKQVTYAKLAELTSIPLSTLKKAMARKGLTVETILRIAQALEMPPDEILKFANVSRQTSWKFNSTQEQYFIEDLRAYGVFILLYRGGDKSSVVRRLGITGTDYEKILRQLELHKLVERFPNNLVKVVPKGVLSLPDSSSLRNVLMKEVAANFVRRFDEVKSRSGSKFFAVGSVVLTEQSLRKFAYEIQVMQDAILETTGRERRMFNSGSLKAVTYSIGIAPYDSTVPSHFDKRR